jgi:hypothetical protein
LLEREADELLVRLKQFGSQTAFSVFPEQEQSSPCLTTCYQLKSLALEKEKRSGSFQNFIKRMQYFKHLRTENLNQLRQKALK